MADALRISMNSGSIQPPNQLMQQNQDSNKEGNGERVSNTKYQGNVKNGIKKKSYKTIHIIANVRYSKFIYHSRIYL